MSAIIKSYDNPHVGKMCDMMQTHGQLGIIRDNTSDYNGHIVLRTYDNFVSLTNPKCTWSNVGRVGLLVEVLPAGTIVEYGSEV